MSALKLEDLMGTYRLNGLRFRAANQDDVLRAIEDGGPVAILDRFRTAKSRINSDQGLNGVGRGRALVDAAKAANDALEKWIGPKLANYAACEDAALSKLRSAAASTSTSSDVGARLEAAMLRAEIRREVSSASPEQVELLYRNGPAIMRQALEELPKVTLGQHGIAHIEPFVSDSVRAEVAIRAGGAADPATADQLADVRAIREVYQTAVALAKRELAEAAPGSVDGAGDRYR